MKLKREMYLRGRIYHAGDFIEISYSQWATIKAWIDHKSLATYAEVCINCFNVHGLLWVPYKVVKVFLHTYVDKFYKTVAANEPQEEETANAND